MLRYFENETTDATLVRRSDGAYVDGEWIPAGPVETPLRIIVPQPVTSNELIPLPEGEKVSNYRKTWSESLLRTRADGSDADRIRYDGRTYEVWQVDERDVLGNFYRVVMREEI